jgi:hypothetical protein
MLSQGNRWGNLYRCVLRLKKLDADRDQCFVGAPSAKNKENRGRYNKRDNETLFMIKKAGRYKEPELIKKYGRG